MMLLSPPLVTMGEVLDGLVQTIGKWVVKKGLMFADWNTVGKVDKTLHLQGQQVELGRHLETSHQINGNQQQKDGTKLDTRLPKMDVVITLASVVKLDG